MFPIVSCLSKAVSKKVKDGIHDVANNGLAKAQEIELSGNLSPNDTKIIEMSKSHCNAMKRFADSLKTCES